MVTPCIGISALHSPRRVLDRVGSGSGFSVHDDGTTAKQTESRRYGEFERLAPRDRRDALVHATKSAAEGLLERGADHPPRIPGGGQTVTALPSLRPD